MNPQPSTIAAIAVTQALIRRHLMCARWYDNRPDRLMRLRVSIAKIRSHIKRQERT